MILAGTTIIGSETLESEVASFLTATGISNYTQIFALQYLVSSLKENNLWSKINCLYPMIGGTSTTHSYNLVNTAQFQLTFYGGWTHSSTGALPNATNATADTAYVPSVQMSQDNAHISYYSRTQDGQKDWAEIGCNVTASQRTVLHLQWSDGNRYGDMWNASTGRVSQFIFLAANTQGLFMLTRPTTNSLVMYRNAGSLASNTNASTATLPNRSILLDASYTDAAVPTQFSGRECSFASFGTGFNQSESTAYYNIVQNYQTLLSRQV